MIVSSMFELILLRVDVIKKECKNIVKYCVAYLYSKNEITRIEQTLKK